MCEHFFFFGNLLSACVNDGVFQIANELVDELARRYFSELVRRIKAAEPHNGELLAGAVQVYLEARRLLEQQTVDREARIRAARELARGNLHANYPIRSRIPEWMERQLKAAEPVLAPPLPEALWQMQQGKLTDATIYLGHHLEFQENLGSATRCISFLQVSFS